MAVTERFVSKWYDRDITEDNATSIKLNCDCLYRKNCIYVEKPDRDEIRWQLVSNYPITMRKSWKGSPDKKSWFSFLDHMVCHRKHFFSLINQLTNLSFNDFFIKIIKYTRKDLDEQSSDLLSNWPGLKTDGTVTTPHPFRSTRSRISAWILKQSKHELLPFMANLILTYDAFHTSMEKALIKKQT